MTMDPFEGFGVTYKKQAASAGSGRREAAEAQARQTLRYPCLWKVAIYFAPMESADKGDGIAVNS